MKVLSMDFWKGISSTDCRTRPEGIHLQESIAMQDLQVIQLYSSTPGACPPASYDIWTVRIRTAGRQLCSLAVIIDCLDGNYGLLFIRKLSKGIIWPGIIDFQNMFQIQIIKGKKKEKNQSQRGRRHSLPGAWLERWHHARRGSPRRSAKFS